MLEGVYRSVVLFGNLAKNIHRIFIPTGSAADSTLATNVNNSCIDFLGVVDKVLIDKVPLLIRFNKVWAKGKVVYPLAEVFGLLSARHWPHLIQTLPSAH